MGFGVDDEWERSPYRYYWKQLRMKMMLANRHVIFKMHDKEDDSAVIKIFPGIELPKGKA